MSFESQCMLTCIGNKRKLVHHILKIIENDVLPDKPKLNIVDGFAGSGVVSRTLLNRADTIHINDLEQYSYTMNYCFFIKPMEEDIETIKYHINEMNKIAIEGPYKPGIICKHYAPKDSKNIKMGERCFYTRENALIIDSVREYIDKCVDKKLFNYCITPLLIKMSINTNTAGVFKGFYKDKTGIGKFGGSNGDALERIEKRIEFDYPIWSDSEYTAQVYNKNVNELIKELPDDIDVIYLDPPYNQHPYSSNYFMLNLIIKNIEPLKLSKVSGIPEDWNRSDYNYKHKAVTSMIELLKDSLTKSKYVLLSYNNEGIINTDDWVEILKDYKVDKKEIRYDTYKGSRNLKNRDNKVIEQMYLIYI